MESTTKQILYLSLKLFIKTLTANFFIFYCSSSFVSSLHVLFHLVLNPISDLLDDLVLENSWDLIFQGNLFLTPEHLFYVISYYFLLFIYEALFSLLYGVGWGLTWGGHLYLLGVWSLYPWIFFWTGYGKMRTWFIQLPRSLFTTRTDVISPDFRVSDREQVSLLFLSRDSWIMRSRYDKFLRSIALWQKTIWKFPRLANFIKEFYLNHGYLEWIVFSIYNNPFYLFDLGRHWFFIYSREHWIELVQWLLFTFMTGCFDIYYFIVVKAIKNLENLLASFWENLKKKWKPEEIWFKELALMGLTFGQMCLNLLSSAALFFVAYKFWLPLFFIFKVFSIYFIFIVEGPWRLKLKLLVRGFWMLFRLSFFYIYFYYGWYFCKLLVFHLPNIRIYYKEIYDKENISPWKVFDFYIHRFFNIILILMAVFTSIVKDLVYHFCENLQILRDGYYVWNIHLLFLDFDSDKKRWDEVINFSRLFK